MNLLALLLASWVGTSVLPNPDLTPGAVADTNVRIICAKDYDRTHRPDRQTAYEMKLKVLALYDIPLDQIHTVEADALVPVGIGGSHFSIKNIWPQKCAEWKGFRCVAGDAYVKDLKEVKARRTICKILLSNPSAAQQLLLKYQQQFMIDWRKN